MVWRNCVKFFTFFVVLVLDHNRIHHLSWLFTAADANNATRIFISVNKIFIKVDALQKKLVMTREGPRGIDPRKSPGFPHLRGDGAGTGIGLQNLRGQGGDGEH